MSASMKSPILGEVEWALRNADGSVARSGREENLYTRTGRRNIMSTYVGNASGVALGLPTWVFIHTSEHPAGVNQGLRCLRTDTLSPTVAQNITPTIASYTRTFTGSFLSPSGQRTIRGMGFGGSGYYAPSVSEGGIRGVSAYLKFTTPVVQEVGQIFEFVYKQTLVPDLSKSLRRFNPWTPVNEAQRISYLVNSTMPGTETYSTMRCTWGSHYFVDGALVHRGTQPVTQDALNSYTLWARQIPTTITPNRFVRSAVRTFLTSDARNTYHQGPVGMFACSHAKSGDSASVAGAIGASETYNRAATWNALASHEGTLTPVYKHPVGETYAWNVTASIALSQGSVEVRGPYIPDEHKSPWHWLHYVVIDDAGDTDGGTEGTYHVRRLGWGGYPYPTFYGRANTSWDSAEQIAAYFADSLGSTGFGSYTHQIAFDGEFYWLAHYATGVNARLSRWRAGSNEQYWLNSIGDNTRWQPFTAPDANSLAYGVASDGAGLTWLLAPSSVLASQKLYAIDNTKPGRHYQRPSGVVDNAAPQTFTVDADDEIHAMFPFAVGDVGKQIRFVNAVNGADSTRTITAYNSPTSVDVDGAAFVDETNITWHWVTVATKATNAWPAACGSILLYDAANTRLWTHSASGLHYSNDGGVTWGTVDELNGLSTALAKSVKAQDGYLSTRTFLVGAAGVLYWIDTNNAVNKYVPGPSGPSGTHTRIAIASLPAPPGGYTTGTLTTLVWDPCAPDIAGDSAGALWIGQDLIAGRCFWRIPCGAFAGGASYGETAAPISGTSDTYLHGSFQVGFASPDGKVYLRCVGYADQWKIASFDEATGALSWASAGGIWFGLAGATGSSGDIHGRGNGIVFARASTETAAIDDTTKNYHGGMVGAPVTYRYDDVAAIWRPWHGSGAQFDARYGTTNGGKRKCHASWQSILLGQQPGNIELRFVQAGGATLPADEFITGESFTFGAAFGVSRTNTQDMTWTIEQSFADMEQLVETEAIKIASWPTYPKVYYWRVSGSTGETPVPLGASAYPTNLPAFDSGGVNYGWLPARNSSYSGGGSLPNSFSGPYGTASPSQTMAGIDLGASPPAISRLVTWLSNTKTNFAFHNYHRASTERGRMRVYYSDDNAVWTEVPEVRFKLNGSSAPDAGYANVYVEHHPGGGSDPAAGGTWNPCLVTFDLEGAGLSVPARTHRYWQVHIGTEDTSNLGDYQYFGGLWASDASDVPIGFSSAYRIDEAHDADFGDCEITAVDFIQTRTGLSGQGGINTVDDGDADGRTNIVTIASGTFDTGVISTVTDYLAWKETPSVGSGYVRRRHGAPGTPGYWTTGKQARSRIIAVTTTQITVADDIIPDSLAAVDFEIRRPATGTILSAGSMPRADRQTGYFMLHNGDVGREFRVTRKGVIRLP